MIGSKTVKMGGRPFKIHFERFESAAEAVEVNRDREITNSSFENARTKRHDEWSGVKSFSEVEELLRTGYQPTVDAMKDVWKGKSGTGTRFSFRNEIVGYAPVVPLALKGVPNCMMSMQMKPIKAKVLDVYYDITSSCGTSSDAIIKVGQSILGAIIDLEREGYRFNLYAVQTYSGGSDCDMLVVKVKSAGQPLDLKRVSFPLTHTAFFRVFGFDWYSRVPGGKYRGCYGHAMGYDYSESAMNDMAKDMFGKNAVYISCSRYLGKSKEQIKEELTNGNKQN